MSFKRFAGIGPVQMNAHAMLKACDCGTLSISVAERSPLGARAIRIRPDDSNGSAGELCAKLVRWLEGRPSVEAVMARPPNVYVRITTDALCSWVSESLSECGLQSGQEGEGLFAVVRFNEAEANSSMLDQFRRASVGRAIAAMIAARGCRVHIESASDGDKTTRGLGNQGESDGIEVDVWRGHAAQSDNHEIVRAPVAGVDLPHGPMRARHGGAVTVADLIRDIRKSQINGQQDVRNTDLNPTGEVHQDAVLAFVLFRTERTRRIQLDDAKLCGEVRNFEAIRSARRFIESCRENSAPENSEPAKGNCDQERIRELASEIDLLFCVMARAVSELEPAIIARYVRTLAQRVEAARPQMFPNHPLWSAAGNAIDIALAQIGIGICCEPNGFAPCEGAQTSGIAT